MKPLNELIKEYTYQLQQGELQVAYRGVLSFIGSLRSHIAKQYPYFSSGSMYLGQMDITYFSITTSSLSEQGLKVLIVYLHEKGRFEMWLCARNREISKRFQPVFTHATIEGFEMFHDRENADAIIECELVSSPDFEDPAALMIQIEASVVRFIDAVQQVLMSLT